MIALGAPDPAALLGGARPNPAATPDQQALLDFTNSLPALRPEPERSQGRYVLPHPDTARKATR